MNHTAAVFEPKTTTALPAECKYPTSMSPNVDHEQVPEPRDSPSDSEWQRVAISLEKCMSKLVETNDKLVTSVRPCEKSSTSPSRVKVIVPTFSGDPLQYPVWSSAFKALVDARDWDADTKLNLLNQYVSGGPKQVVEHYLLIGTEDAYVKAKSVLRERYGNPNVVSSAFLSKLDKWPKIDSPNRLGSAFHIRPNALLRDVSAYGMCPLTGGVRLREVSAYGRCPFAGGVRLRDVSAYGRCPLTGGVRLREVSSYERCLLTGGVRLREVSAYERCPLTGGVRLREVPAYGRCPLTGGVRLREVSAYGRCPLTGGVRLREVSAYGRCPLTRGVRLREVSAYGRCLLTGGVRLREVSAYGRCPLTGGVRLREVSAYGRCPLTGGACLREVPAYGRCPLTGGVRLREVSAYERCPLTGGVRLREVPAYGRCPLTGGVRLREVSAYGRCPLTGGVRLREVSAYGRCLLTGGACLREVSAYGRCPLTGGVRLREVSAYGRCSLTGGVRLREVSAYGRCPLTGGVRLREVSAYGRCLLTGGVRLREVFAYGRCPLTGGVRLREVSAYGRCPLTGGVRLREVSAYGRCPLTGGACLREVPAYGRCPLTGGVRLREVSAYGRCSLTGGVRLREVSAYGRCPLTGGVRLREVSAYGRCPLTGGFRLREVSAYGRCLPTGGVRLREVSAYGRCPLTGGVRLREVSAYGRCPLTGGVRLREVQNRISLPYNRHLAEKRWRQLNSRFKKNPKFLQDYKTFMKDVVDLCAEKVPTERLDVRDGKVNYVPHTGVYHPKKPGQIRVVFDCSARYEGVSLNDCLLQVPDLLNGLLGVLCRFREEKIAFMVDVKSMFHQFYVSEQYRDLLRFLWWEDGDQEKDVVEYRMKVHLFGAASSPGCANFGLKRAADDGEEEFGTQAAAFIRDDFYVDDGLKSTPTVSEAINLIESSKAICAKAGMRLHKLTCNSKEVLQAIPIEDRSKNIREIDLKVDPLPIERALGVVWCVEDDSFQFRIELRDRPFTRRGVLSTVSSIYDPNGYVAPVTLKGKQILQQMCRDKLDWDSPVPDSLRPSWEKWRTEITDLEKLKVPRCFKTDNFDTIKAVEVHHFSDASVEGYGQCSYLRLVNQENHAHCSFVVGKARVTPLKQSTIPRLELAAATTSAKMSEFLRAELSYPKLDEYFWTDSQVVLGYVKNEARRFHVYVANRVQQIREMTDPNAWMYVHTSINPADDASRGLTARQLLNDSHWLTGPEFLWEDGPFEVKQPEEHPLSEADPEIKKVKALTTKVLAQTLPDHLNTSRFSHISNWFKAKKAVALCLRLLAKFRRREIKAEAEKVIIRCVQSEYFQDELQILRSLGANREKVDRRSVREKKQTLKKTSSIYKLDPFIDQDGLVRVGGRIGNADVPEEVRHPVILPRKCHVTTLLIRSLHQKVNHMGRSTTHNELRQCGYWILGASAAVSNVISQCVTCRRQRRPLEQQKMSSLPKDRVEQVPPFSFCAVDYFGPFVIKERRSELKRYGVLFTCLAPRGVHLETANSLNTSSFINALRRFLARRGPVRQIRCDQGTNFVGARNELKAALTEMDEIRVSEYLLEQG
ncbi:hypothetical protein QZH41_015611, partial [Actinostola sp. cb2023]